MKVLLVEDDGLFRKIAKNVFSQSSHELLLAENGTQGLKITMQHCPAVIFLDLHLPDMSGEEILRHLKSNPRTHSSRVLILSGSDPGDVGTFLMSLGAEDILQKPLTPIQMLRILEDG